MDTLDYRHAEGLLDWVTPAAREYFKQMDRKLNEYCSLQDQMDAGGPTANQLRRAIRLVMDICQATAMVGAHSAYEGKIKELEERVAKLECS